MKRIIRAKINLDHRRVLKLKIVYSFDEFLKIRSVYVYTDQSISPIFRLGAAESRQRWHRHKGKSLVDIRLKPDTRYIKCTKFGYVDKETGTRIQCSDYHNGFEIDLVARRIILLKSENLSDEITLFDLEKYRI